MRHILTLLVAPLLLAGIARAENVKLEIHEKAVGNVNAVVVETITPSPDGRRLAYAARTGDKLVLTVDGKSVSSPYDAFGAGGIVFSPSSARVAAMASNAENKWLLVIDGVEGKTYDTFAKDSLQFSPNSKHIAVVAARGPKRLVVIDGVEGMHYDDVKAFAFAPPAAEKDALRYAYAARQEAQWRVVTESGAGEWLDEVGDQPIAYAPGGKRMAYAARRFDRWFVVADGKEGSPYNDIAHGSIRFSPDGGLLAYSARVGPAWKIVVKGTALATPFDAIDPATLAFVQDGKSVAFAARTGNAWAVVEGVAPGPAFEALAFPPVFGPRAAHPTYVGVRGGRHTVVVDGKENSSYDEVMEAPVFSSDGRLGFVGRRGGQQFAVVDDEEGSTFDAVGRLTFSPDGKRFAYGAQRGNTTVVRIDDRETPPFSGFLPRSRLVFGDDGGTVHAQMFRGAQLLQVTIKSDDRDDKPPQ